MQQHGGASQVISLSLYVSHCPGCALPLPSFSWDMLQHPHDPFVKIKW